MQKNKRIHNQISERSLIPYALTPYALIAFALILTGCARPHHREVIEQICLSNMNKAQAMQTAEDVLARMHFSIDKSDAELGIIRTRPLPAAQSFEFWRSDNVGSFNSAEANLHSIRRTAELGISQQGGQLCISCEVKVQRLSLPQHKVTSSARAYELFTPSSQSMQVLALHDEQKKNIEWLDVGNDNQLTTEILKRISSMLEGRPSPLDTE